MGFCGVRRQGEQISSSAAFHPGRPRRAKQAEAARDEGHAQNTRTHEPTAKDLLPYELGFGHGSCHAASVCSLLSDWTEEIKGQTRN